MELAAVLENIERLLKAKKRSADEVSRAAGVPDAIRNLRRHLRGQIKAEPTTRTISALAEELGVTVDYLLSRRPAVHVEPAPGVREALLRQIDWHEQERQRAIDQLAALDEAESGARKTPKRKIR